MQGAGAGKSAPGEAVALAFNRPVISITMVHCAF
jgi:hypothetical protein